MVWLELVVDWLSDSSINWNFSSLLITSLSNFIVLVSTALAVSKTDIINTKNSSWLQLIDKEQLALLESIARKLHCKLMLTIFSWSSNSNSTALKIQGPELLLPFSSLMNEASMMIGVPTKVSSLLDKPISRFLQHLQVLKYVGAISQISNDDLQNIKAKFLPIMGSKIIEAMMTTVSR